MTRRGHRRWFSMSAKALLILLLTAADTETPSAFRVGQKIGMIAVVIFVVAMAIAAWPEKKMPDREKPDERDDLGDKQ